MKSYKWVLILLNLVLLLIYFNYSVAQKEEILKNGQLILLELAPVDPRSLMQGDYMELRYNIAFTNQDAKILKRGFCVIQVDSMGVGKKVRFQADRMPLNKNELLIEYTSANQWDVKIGAESFFFQEGQSQKFEEAKYGGLRIDKNGNSILIGLYDKNGEKID